MNEVYICQEVCMLDVVKMPPRHTKKAREPLEYLHMNLPYFHNRKTLQGWRFKTTLSPLNWVQRYAMKTYRYNKRIKRVFLYWRGYSSVTIKIEKGLGRARATSTSTDLRPRKANGNLVRRLHDAVSRDTTGFS